MTGALVHHEGLPPELWPENTSQAYRVLYEGLGYHGGPREVSGMVLVEVVQRFAEDLRATGNGNVDTGELVAAIRAFCLGPTPNHPGSWLFGTI